MKQRTLDNLLDRLMDDLGHGVAGSVRIVKSPKGNTKRVTLRVPSIGLRTVFDSRELRPVALGDEVAYEGLRVALAEAIAAGSPHVTAEPVTQAAISEVTEGDAINEIYDGGGVAIRHTPPHVVDYPHEPEAGQTVVTAGGRAAGSRRVTLDDVYVTDHMTALEAGYAAWLEG